MKVLVEIETKGDDAEALSTIHAVLDGGTFQEEINTYPGRVRVKSIVARLDDDEGCNLSATELACEITRLVEIGQGQLAESLMGDNWVFICNRLRLSDSLDGIEMGLSPRLEIASRVMAAWQSQADSTGDASAVAREALQFADALIRRSGGRVDR